MRADSAAPPVKVTAVTLATGGLAHVIGAMIEPGDEMRISVEREQVADVLRTLVVTGEAPVLSIDLPAAEPVGEQSVTGRLLAGDLADPATVLASLIGEPVELAGGPHSLSGRLLAFSVVTIPGTDDIPSRPGLRFAVTGEDGRVAYATFPSLDQLSVGGPAVEARMRDLVPALGESVDDGRRELTVRLADAAKAGFSFVVPTTVWRPSYRAMVSDDGTVALQGWATLENTTGLDWEDIDLSLAVGTPVAYRQDVYSPLRTSRPEAPFSVGRTVETGIVPGDFAEPENAVVMAMDRKPAQAMSSGIQMKMLSEAPPAAEVVTGGPAEAGTAVTIFRVAGEIDLEAGRTLTVPFLSGAKEAARIVYFEIDGSDPPEPMDALELSFDEEATVPGGLVAVYDEGRFAGDARFAGADGGETRILPFALSAHLNAAIRERDDQRLVGALFSGGVLWVERENVSRLTLALEAVARTTLVVDLPGTSKATVSAKGSDGVDATLTTPKADLARLRAELPSGTSRIVLTATKRLSKRYRVGQLPDEIVKEVLSIGDCVDENTKARLREAAAIAERIVGIDRRISTLEADVSDLREAVALDRENLEAINVTTPEGQAVRQRIVDRTNAIDAALSEVRDLRRERMTEQTRLREG